MNREIKLRAWNKQLSKFLSNEEWYLDLNGKLCFLDIGAEVGDDVVECTEELYVIQQYTGLKDSCDGKEIYEGDILRVHSLINQNDVVAEVVWLYTGWAIRIDTNYFNLLQYTDLEVIGNIFENKELLQ